MSNNRLNNVEEKISKLENIAIETIQNETQIEKRLEQISRASVSYGAMPSALLYLYWSLQKGRGGWYRKKFFEEIMVEIFPNLMKTIKSHI